MVYRFANRLSYFFALHLCFFTESLQVLEHILLEIFNFLKRPKDAALHYLVHNGDLMAAILMQFNSSRL